MAGHTAEPETHVADFCAFVWTQGAALSYRLAWEAARGEAGCCATLWTWRIVRLDVLQMPYVLAVFRCESFEASTRIWPFTNFALCRYLPLRALK